MKGDTFVKKSRAILEIPKGDLSSLPKILGKAARHCLELKVYKFAIRGECGLEEKNPKEAVEGKCIGCDGGHF